METNGHTVVAPKKPTPKFGTKACYTVEEVKEVPETECPRYVPSFIPPPLATKGKESERKKEEEKPKEKDKGKSRNIDHFMEELKHEQEMRERRNQDRELWRDGRPAEHSISSRFDELPDDFDPSGKLPGSFDDGDPQTSNLYVGNLSPQVDENFLLRTFGRFGPIASVKIMWPRTEEERRRQKNCGFVAFMNRADGQAAKDEMQGVVVYEYELKIGWGKSVALPSQALPAPPPGQMAIRSKEGNTVILSGPSGPPVTSVPNQNSELVLTPNVPDIMVTPPEDEHLRHVIDTMALYVLDGGCAFEQAIMERGRGNPLFNFLFALGSKEHTYYVWRLFSFAQGDTLQRWRTEPFIMITGSGRWTPPSLRLAKSSEHDKESGSTHAAGRSRILTNRVKPQRTLMDQFDDMPRALILERSQIKDAMGFSLDNADAVGELARGTAHGTTVVCIRLPTGIVIGVDSRFTYKVENKPPIYTDGQKKYEKIRDKFMVVFAGKVAPAQDSIKEFEALCPQYEDRLQRPLSVNEAAFLFGEYLHQKYTNHQNFKEVFFQIFIAISDEWGTDAYYVDIHGKTTRVDDICSMGTGGTYAHPIVDEGYRASMSPDDAFQLAIKAIRQAALSDDATGGPLRSERTS